MSETGKWYLRGGAAMTMQVQRAYNGLRTKSDLRTSVCRAVVLWREDFIAIANWPDGPDRPLYTSPFDAYLALVVSCPC